MARIAIFGATGFVGTALSLKLLDLGHEVVALSRHPERWPLQHKNLRTIRGDIMNQHAVNEVLESVECAYYLVHGLDVEAEDFEFQEAKGATCFARAAKRAKLKKVIYLGGLGPEAELSAHLRSRHLVGEILSLSSAACVEFRASIVLGAQSTSFEMIKALAHR
ncbi:MAG: NAD(P)H-binding protein, partial [Bacteriovoracia bacterium]